MNKEKNVKLENDNEIITDIAVLQYAEQATQRKYRREVEIENGIISQSGQMQAAFSFVTAAIFMVAPIACELRGNKMSLNLVLAIFTVVSLAMICSLVFATMAHQRIKHNEEDDADILNKYILKNEEWFKDEKFRIDFQTQTNILLQKSLAETNERRLIWLRASTYSFYTAIGLCVIGFIIYIVNM